MRRTGIEVIGDAPWGTHFCQFYQTPQDLVDILVPYFAQGLRDNEFCMWITSKPLDADDARKALSAAVPDLQDRMRNGQIEILDYSQWYTKSGAFQADEVLQGWVDKLNGALQKGYDGLRLTGNTFWLEKADWNRFTDYEERVNSVIGRYRMMAVCTYSLDRYDAAEIIDVVTHHPFALIKKAGQWKIIESSEHKKIEDALRQERDFISAVLNTAGVLVVVMDREGRIRRFNRACEDMTGYSAEEVQGRILWDFLIPPEDMDGVKATWKTLVAGMFPSQHENHWLAKAGSRRLMAWTNTVLLGPTNAVEHVVATGIDITERRNSELDFQNSEARYRRLFETAMDGILILDAESGLVSDVNPFLTTMLGYTREDIVGKKLWEMGFFKDVQKSLEAFRRLQKEGYVRYEDLPLKRKDGSLFEVEFVSNVYRVNDTRVIQCNIRDITERKQIEDVLRFLVQSGGTTFHGDFFQTLAPYLARRLGVDFVCIDRLTEGSLTAQTMALWCDGKFEDNVSYTLKDTPCGDVVNRNTCCFPKDVRRLFPQDDVLQTMLAESYVGTILKSSQGNPIGLIAVIGRKPLSRPEIATTILQLVGVRAASELERRQADDALHASIMELTHFNRAAVDRELRMIELKKQVNELCAQAGLPPAYDLENIKEAGNPGSFGMERKGCLSSAV